MLTWYRGISQMSEKKGNLKLHEKKRPDQANWKFRLYFHPSWCKTWLVPKYGNKSISTSSTKYWDKRNTFETHIKEIAKQISCVYDLLICQAIFQMKYNHKRSNYKSRPRPCVHSSLIKSNCVFQFHCLHPKTLYPFNDVTLKLHHPVTQKPCNTVTL